MNIFPTQYSTLSAAALAKYVEKQYGYNGLSGRLLLRGVSDTYLLEGPADKYILKIYRDAHRSLEEINGEVQLLNIYKKHHLPLSYPIADEEGRYIQAFAAAEGTRHGVLFTYAEGKVVADPTEAQVRTVGREMARLHNVAANLELNYKRKEYNIDTMIVQPLEKVAPLFKDMPEEYEGLKRIAAKAIEKLNSIDKSNFSYGYCQFDFMPQNFHFVDDQVTFFDFDFAGKGYLVNDVMSFINHYNLHGHFGKMTREAADKVIRQFLEAYRSVRPLSAEEEEAIPALNVGFWQFYLGFQYENFDDWSNTFFNERWIKERAKLMIRLAEANGIV
jgi:Ser/Thr protein kinase RdoA (MazF antagonist)